MLGMSTHSGSQPSPEVRGYLEITRAGSLVFNVSPSWAVI